MPHQPPRTNGTAPIRIPMPGSESDDDVPTLPDDPAVQQAHDEIVRLREAVSEANKRVQQARETARRRKTAEWDEIKREYDAALNKAFDVREKAFKAAEARYVGGITPAQAERDTLQRALDAAWSAYHDAERAYMTRLQAEASAEGEAGEKKEGEDGQ